MRQTRFHRYQNEQDCTFDSGEAETLPVQSSPEGETALYVIIRSKSKAGNFISLSIFGCQHDDGVGMMFPDFLA